MRIRAGSYGITVGKIIFILVSEIHFQKLTSITAQTAAAYMTGIMPIKKDRSQSALSDFTEYTILDPSIFTEYTGFTENDVRQRK